MMAGYLAGEWQWNESLTNEIARFLLPLSWLVRVSDTPLHRSWLARVATDMLASQDRLTGAIKQEFGTGNESGRCSPCAPGSNAAYGSGEGPLMHDGTEPIADSLYTLSFAVAGLREAAVISFLIPHDHDHHASVMSSGVQELIVQSEQCV